MVLFMILFKTNAVYLLMNYIFIFKMYAEKNAYQPFRLKGGS